MPAGTPLHFHIDLAEVFAYDSEGKEQHARAEPYRKDYGCPSGNRVAGEMAHKHVGQYAERYEHAGRTEKDVMPSAAKLSILPTGYFDLPNTRGFRS